MAPPSSAGLCDPRHPPIRGWGAAGQPKMDVWTGRKWCRDGTGSPLAQPVPASGRTAHDAKRGRRSAVRRCLPGAMPWICPGGKTLSGPGVCPGGAPLQAERSCPTGCGHVSFRVCRGRGKRVFVGMYFLLDRFPDPSKQRLAGLEQRRSPKRVTPCDGPQGDRQSCGAPRGVQLGECRGTGGIVPFVNRTFEWGVVIATFLSVLSTVPRRCARLTDFLHPKVR